MDEKFPYCSLVYRVRNIGDMIQTLALSRLLPQTNGVFRHAINRVEPNQTLVMNGFLERNAPCLQITRVLFAGVSGPYWHKRAYYSWFKSSPWPVAARDPHTEKLLRRESISADFTGCATMTFPRYSGIRKGVYSVDFPGPGVRLTHEIPRRMSVKEQWQLALEYLEYYRTAQAVYTSRLHVALPCLAMGTPVYIASPIQAPLPERFSILDEIGIPYDRLCEADLSKMAKGFKQFLSTRLQLSVDEEEPKMPVLAVPDRLNTRESIAMAFSDAKSWVSKRINELRSKHP